MHTTFREATHEAGHLSFIYGDASRAAKCAGCSTNSTSTLPHHLQHRRHHRRRHHLHQCQSPLCRIQEATGEEGQGIKVLTAESVRRRRSAQTSVRAGRARARPVRRGDARPYARHEHGGCALRELEDMFLIWRAARQKQAVPTHKRGVVARRRQHGDAPAARGTRLHGRVDVISWLNC